MTSQSHRPCSESRCPNPADQRRNRERRLRLQVHSLFPIRFSQPPNSPRAWARELTAKAQCVQSTHRTPSPLRQTRLRGLITKAQSIAPAFAMRPTSVGVLSGAASSPRISVSHARKANLLPVFGERLVGLSRGEWKKCLSWIGFAIAF